VSKARARLRERRRGLVAAPGLAERGIFRSVPVILPSPSAVPRGDAAAPLGGLRHRARLAAQSAEHLGILARLKAGDRAGAADVMVHHFDAGRASKARLLEDSKLRLSALAPSPPAGGSVGATPDDLGHPGSAA
jgi:hypothetical protein